MTPTQEAAMRQALEAMSSFESGSNGLFEGEFAEEIAALRAALAEEAMQRLTDVQQKLEADLSRCPKCNGPADNGHDRSIPPSPYWCSRCMGEPPVPRDCPDGHQLTDEVIADLWHQNGGFHHHFARAIERWLKGNP